LVSDVARLDEVVVIGYGTLKKRDVTGAISSLTTDKFNPVITTAPERLMQGKIAV
jgi:iron complex outermembrane receptor protein